MLELVDQLLSSGVVADGDIMMGLAGVDLIYLRLSALLCAADRVLPYDRGPSSRRSGSAMRQPGWTASRSKRRRGVKT
jgi:hypothetical protein